MLAGNGPSAAELGCRSPLRSPTSLPAQHNAVVAAELQVGSVQNAPGHPAAPQFQFLGGSRLQANAKAQHAGRPAAAVGIWPNAGSAGPVDMAGTSSDNDSPLPTRVVRAGAIASSSRGAGASTSRAAFQPASNTESPSTPRAQIGGHADEYASPAAMRPPRALQEPVRASAPKPPLSSKKRITAAPVNAPFKRPYRR